jgi:magnesium transporter
MHTLLVCQNGQFGTGLEPSALKEVLANPEAVVWLDICDPTEQDIALLRDRLEFHPLAIEDAVRAHERPKVDAYGKYYFIAFYAASYNGSTDEIELQAIHLFLGANYLVTVHQGQIRQIGETAARWQAPNSPLSHKVSALVYALLDALVDEYFPLMDQVADRIEDLEDTIFTHFSESAIQTIFSLKTDLLRFRHVVAPERDVLNVLLRRELPVFKAEDTAYLQDIYDHIVRVTDNIDTYRDLLSSALDSYLSLQSNNLNQIMKLLTMASIILRSNALVAGVYGMNFRFMPELGWKIGYPFALGLMVVVSLVLILYFRLKRWL